MSEGPVELVVDRAKAAERIELDESSWVDMVRGFVPDPDEATATLLRDVPWAQNRTFRYEQYRDDPRLAFAYRHDAPLPHPVLRQTALVLEARYHRPMGGVVLIQYRDGNDGVGAHRDDDLRYIDDTIVAILTFGAQRPWLVSPYGGDRWAESADGTRARDPRTIDLAPASGDLLVMGGAAQRDWIHAVPGTRGVATPRISATWRWTAKTGRPKTGAGWAAPRRFGDRRR